MKRIIGQIIQIAALTPFILQPAIANVTPESCLDIDRSVGVSMTNAMVNDFGISEKDILLDKTKLTLLSQNKVTPELAELYARQSYKKDSSTTLKESVYKESYSQWNAKNIVVKYDYVNKTNKHNILIGSLLVNDNECSVRFNGYIIVKREF